MRLQVSQELEKLAKEETAENNGHGRETITIVQTGNPMEEVNSQKESTVAEEGESPDFTEVQSQLREKVLHHISQYTKRQRLPTNQQLQNQNVRNLLKVANEVISIIPTKTLKESNWLMYSTAAVITAELGYKLPKWGTPGTPK